MNPHAPEFVPKRAWQGSEGGTVGSGSGSSEDEKVKKMSSDVEKAELARQILLSFIVKSVRDNSEVKSESESESGVVKSDSAPPQSQTQTQTPAIMKIIYGDDEGVVEKNKDDNGNGDGEGFVMVTKRRRNKQQFASGVSGLYGHTQQQSVSASVR